MTSPFESEGKLAPTLQPHAIDYNKTTPNVAVWTTAPNLSDMPENFTTDRFYLKLLHDNKTDAAYVYSLWQDPKVRSTGMVNSSGIFTEDDATKSLKGDSINRYGIFLKGEQRPAHTQVEDLLGITSIVWDGPTGCNALDFALKTEHWKQRYATEAANGIKEEYWALKRERRLRMIAGFLLTGSDAQSQPVDTDTQKQTGSSTLQAHNQSIPEFTERLIAFVLSENPASDRILTNIGFELSGPPIVIDDSKNTDSKVSSLEMKLYQMMRPEDGAAR